MAEANLEYSFSQKEIIYLSSLIGADTVIGAGDPFFGWLADEIEEAYVKARESLIEKGAISKRDTGGILIDVRVASLMDAYTRPDITFLTYRKPFQSAGEFRLFHVSEFMSIEQSHPREGGEELKLTARSDRDSAKERITEIIGLEDGNKTADVGFATSMDKLSEIMAAAERSGNDDVVSLLKREGAGEESIEMMGETLSSSFDYSSLLGMKLGGASYKMEGIGFLGNGEYLWRVNPRFKGDKIPIELSTCTGSEANEAIQNFLSGMSPLLSSLPEES